MDIIFRFAKPDEAHLLAPLNAKLIIDEGHRNSMSVEQLTERMTNWLQGEYQAVVFENAASILGYALFRRESECIYIRQLFVLPENRRLGIGRNAITWLRQNISSEQARFRIDVLIGNSTGLAFWRSIGFQDYCITLEMGTSQPYGGLPRPT